MCTLLIGPDGGRRHLVVLKFGSSILSDVEGFRTAAREVRSEVDRGSVVLAVVSAMRGTTDTLLRSASALAERPASGLVAHLLGTGEESAAALLGIALGEVRVNVNVRRPDQVTVRTSGPLDDAEPVAVDVDALRSALLSHEAVVVPGFIGADRTGARSLLGRGGSDLTALLLARWLGADEVRLVKDVDGVYEADPRLAPTAPPLPVASWSEVKRIGNGVVQEKALAYAEAWKLPFRVAAPGGVGTLVGGGGAG